MEVRRCESGKVRRWSEVGSRMPEDGYRRVLAKRWGYDFELFKKVSLAKVTHVSDIH